MTYIKRTSAPARSPLRPSITDLRMFIRAYPGRTGRSAVRIARIVGARTRVSRRTGERVSGFEIRVWKTGRKVWDRTTGFLADDHALDFATVDDLVRVGLIIRDADGVWL